MSMASMVQMCAPPNEHLEGSSAPFIFSTQLAFDCSPLLLNTECANSAFTWQPTKISCSPPMEAQFTPAPNSITATSSHAELQNDRHEDDIDYSFMHAIASSSIIYSDLLSFNASSQLSAVLDMEYLPKAEEMQLDNSQRKLNMYSGGYGGVEDDVLPPAQVFSAAAAADYGQNRSLLQACNYGDDVKLSHLARALTASRARPASINGAARSPLLLAGCEAQRLTNTINEGKFLSNKNTCRVMSSSTTTTTQFCSGGRPDGQSNAKVVQIKSESFEMTSCQNRQECSLPNIGATKGAKQTRKRSATIGSSITSIKTPRIETPPDVVHVRARRGQATDSHSLAERVRREKISQRMKVLQEIVPGCQKVLGKAMMLDEIINYVKSLQRQVEFLSMKLAAANHSAIASIILDKANYKPSNGDIFGDLSTSHHHLMQLEPLISSLMQ